MRTEWVPAALAAAAAAAAARLTSYDFEVSIVIAGQLLHLQGSLPAPPGRHKLGSLKIHQGSRHVSNGAVSPRSATPEDAVSTTGRRWACASGRDSGMSAMSQNGCRRGLVWLFDQPARFLQQPLAAATRLDQPQPCYRATMKVFLAFLALAALAAGAPVEQQIDQHQMRAEPVTAAFALVSE